MQSITKVVPFDGDRPACRVPSPSLILPPLSSETPVEDAPDTKSPEADTKSPEADTKSPEAMPLERYLPYDNGMPLENAADVLWRSSFCARFVLFAGGMVKFNNAVANAIYVSLFYMAFLSCFTGCSINVIIRTTPARNFAMDILTAYIHVPILCGFWFWRNILYYDDGAHLQGLIRSLEKVADPTARATKAANMVMAIKMAGKASVVALLAVTAVVDSGFALPTTNGVNHLSNSMSSANVQGFMFWHATSMWLFIPPVVSCLFSTYGLLAIIGVFHQYAIVSLEIIASDRIIALRDKGGLTIGGFGPENELERALAEEVLLCSIEVECRALQQQMNRTCKMTSTVTCHYLAVCLLEVITAFVDMREGLKPNGPSYTITHGCQDFFHFAAGATGIFVLVGCGGYVTIRTHVLMGTLVRVCRSGELKRDDWLAKYASDKQFDEYDVNGNGTLCRDEFAAKFGDNKRFDECDLDGDGAVSREEAVKDLTRRTSIADHGASQKSLAALRSMLQATLKGFTLAGLPVDVQKMVMFSWALFCLVAGLVIQMAVSSGQQDAHHSEH